MVTMRDVDYETMDYKDDTNILPLPRGFSGLLCAFKAFISHQRDSGISITDAVLTTLAATDFNNFRIGPQYFTPTNPPTTATSSGSSTSDPLRDFRRGIRRDISYFIPLKEDGAWDNWYRATMA
jgi:hypothetical protein